MVSQEPLLQTDLATEESIPLDIIFGRSEAMQGVRKMIDQVRGAKVSILVEGESGTGKEVIAREIHRRSPWSLRSFVKLSCPAIPGTLVESELFGYEKGSFTGAWQTKPGRVELADSGTLFLDEIGEMDLSLQAKLLHVLQDGQFSRIGGRTDCKVDFHLICATNRDLQQGIEAGTFRADLYYRLNVVNIRMPRLCDRREDIPDLAEYLLGLYSRKFGRKPPFFPVELMSLFYEYEWPGNIRELENYIKRYVILGNEEVIIDQLANKMERCRTTAQFHDDGLSLSAYTKRILHEVERNRIRKVLEEQDWNRRRTAKILQISYRTLLYKIKKADLVEIRRGRPSGRRLSALEEPSDRKGFQSS